ncbi:MAG: hypothetical protein OXC40_06715 [Proteobacteria bacterium]|nr:hypothetical protein [Pseudomonadota bacterium]
MLMASCRLGSLGIQPTSQLKGAIDRNHILTLEFTGEFSGDEPILEFQMCSRDPAGATIENSCINPYSVIDRSRTNNTEAYPLRFLLSHIDDFNLTDNDLSYLKQRQKTVTDYVQALDQTNQFTAVGIIAIFAGTLGTRRELMLTTPLTKFSKFRLILSLLLATGGAMGLQFANTQAKKAADMRSSLKDQETPALTTKEPEKWLVLFEHYNTIMSLDDTHLAKLSPVKSYLSHLAILMHLGKFIPEPYLINQVCYPEQSSNTGVLYVPVCKTLI